MPNGINASADTTRGRNATDEITLRDYFDAKLAAIRVEIDWRSVEVNRRLDDLNHHHDQHMDMIARTVPRESWEQRNREVDMRFQNGMTKFEKVDHAITLAGGKSSGVSATWGILATVINLVLVAIALYVALVH